MPVSLSEVPDLRERLIASAIAAAWDRLNIAPVCRPRLSDLDPRDLEILLGNLRRAISSKRCCRRPV